IAMRGEQATKMIEDLVEAAERAIIDQLRWQQQRLTMTATCFNRPPRLSTASAKHHPSRSQQPPSKHLPHAAAPKGYTVTALAARGGAPPRVSSARGVSRRSCGGAPLCRRRRSCFATPHERCASNLVRAFKGLPT